MFVQIGHDDVRKGQAPAGSSREFVETSLRPEWVNPPVVDPKPSVQITDTQPPIPTFADRADLTIVARRIDKSGGPEGCAITVDFIGFFVGQNQKSSRIVPHGPSQNHREAVSAVV
ncbi:MULTISPECIES: hypothetical protein [Mesorhizobium]|uniref:hypothetical protein n=1 Tax=Mesorhizobium TaxID=68287 RepID=UPI0010A94F76|nr:MULTISPECIES: hypothetical protein [Mesorhizobium]